MGVDKWDDAPEPVSCVEQCADPRQSAHMQRSNRKRNHRMHAWYVCDGHPTRDLRTHPFSVEPEMFSQVRFFAERHVQRERDLM